MNGPLDIPVFLQPKTKPYCGPTCLKMILSFHGKDILLKELVKKLPMTSTGIDMCSMGVFLIRLGFAVTIYIDTNSTDAKNEIYKKTKPNFINKGGRLISKGITAQDIRSTIAEGLPIILNVASSRYQGSGHFIVVKNICKTKITINDPGNGMRVFTIKRIMRTCRRWNSGALIATFS